MFGELRTVSELTSFKKLESWLAELEEEYFRKGLEI